MELHVRAVTLNANNVMVQKQIVQHVHQEIIFNQEASLVQIHVVEGIGLTQGIVSVLPA
jgi:hypothetical protein